MFAWQWGQYVSGGFGGGAAGRGSRGGEGFAGAAARAGAAGAGGGAYGWRGGRWMAEGMSPLYHNRRAKPTGHVLHRGTGRADDRARLHPDFPHELLPRPGRDRDLLRVRQVQHLENEPLDRQARQ